MKSQKEIDQNRHDAGDAQLARDSRREIDVPGIDMDTLDERPVAQREMTAEELRDAGVEQPMVLQPTPVSGPMALLTSGIDLDRLEKLWELQVKYEANEARKLYFAAFAAFKAVPIVIERTKHVNYSTAKGITDYHHDDLGITIGKVNEAMAPHGLSVRWNPIIHSNKVVVECIIAHAAGHQEITTMEGQPDDSGGKNPIQAIGSIVSYLQKYTLNAACGLAAVAKVDEDLLSITDEETDWVRAKLVELKMDETEFITKMAIGSLEGMPRYKYRRASQYLMSMGPSEKKANELVNKAKANREQAERETPDQEFAEREGMNAVSEGN